jgi:TM2 domain-containing membrane protein YozV
MSGPGSGGNVVAAVCSFLYPGLGQLVQGRLLAAAIQFLISIPLWFFWMGWVMHLYSSYNAATYVPPVRELR